MVHLQKTNDMRIDILTVVPELLESPFNHSILKRAKDKGLAEIYIHNIRDWSTDKHKKVDDYAFSKGAGMVMLVEPIDLAISDLKSQRDYDEVIFLTPDARQFVQRDANRLSLKENLLILCGHYKGVDQRVRDHLITLELSIGDYVLTGGELAAAIVSDAIVRLIPGVLSDETSALSDSFQDGRLTASLPPARRQTKAFLYKRAADDPDRSIAFQSAIENPKSTIALARLHPQRAGYSLPVRPLSGRAQATPEPGEGSLATGGRAPAPPEFQ